mmetsp:Transcript_45719/g.118171  ORF Transcript_45719/g.118171 Transcript_45719/m.118171 type:complete len:267 (-) Transcript_45719:605-1405(-)
MSRFLPLHSLLSTHISSLSHLLVVPTPLPGSHFFSYSPRLFSLLSLFYPLSYHYLLSFLLSPSPFPFSPLLLHGGKVLLFRRAQLVLPLQFEDPLHRYHSLLHTGEALLVMNSAHHLLHRSDACPNSVIGPNHQARTPVSECLGRDRAVVGRHEHNWMASIPLLHECPYLFSILLFGMNENSICPSLTVCLCSFQCFFHSPSSYERLDSRHHYKIWISLALLARLYLPAELIDGGEGLPHIFPQQGVGLGEELVLVAHPSYVAVLE